MNYGWVCPRCNSIHAPWVSGCSECNFNKFNNINFGTIKIIPAGMTCNHEFEETSAGRVCRLCNYADSNFQFLNNPRIAY